jgi:hypothetical protein
MFDLNNIQVDVLCILDHHSLTLHDKIGFIENGFVPVEMSQGQDSWVDDKKIDHHNNYSHQPSASKTSLKYHGSTKKIIINHVDADCILAGLVLFGAIEKDRKLVDFVKSVSILDMAPIGVNPLDLKYGNLIQTWKNTWRQSLPDSEKDLSNMTAEKWIAAAEHMLKIYKEDASVKELISQSFKREIERLSIALEDISTALVSKSGKIKAIPVSRVPGFDVAFKKTVDGWDFGCLISRIPASGKITLSIPDKETAAKLFGVGGLLNVYPILSSKFGSGGDWGGRETVGGSGRTGEIPIEAVPNILEVLDSLIKG